MKLYVNTAKVRFGEEGITGAEVFFNKKDDNRTFDLNGYIEITPEQYIENFQGNKLAEVVRDELIKKLEDAEVENKHPKEDDEEAE